MAISLTKCGCHITRTRSSFLAPLNEKVITSSINLKKLAATPFKEINNFAPTKHKKQQGELKR